MTSEKRGRKSAKYMCQFKLFHCEGIHEAP